MAETFWDSLLRWLSLANCQRRLPSWADNAQRPVLCVEDIDDEGRVIERHYIALDMPIDDVTKTESKS